MPKVSVIIPVFGTEKYIERCARSLFEQTLDDIEYLFVDDCTPDESISILKKILEDYPNRKPQVIIHKMNHNSGQADVRKWGMLNATGDYVTHCDSDDWVESDMYMRMYNKAISENADVVVCDYIHEMKGKSKTEKGCHNIILYKFIENCLLQKDSWGLWNKIFKRGCLEGVIYPKCNMGEDMMICIQLLSNCKKMAYANHAFYNYCYNADSISKKRTIKNCEQNYLSLKENTEFVVNYITKRFEQNDLDVDLACKYLKMKIQLSLLRIKHLPQYKQLWHEHFQYMPIRFFFHPDICFYYKLVYVLSAFKLFPRKKDRAI